MKTIAERIKEGLALRNMKQADLVEKTGIGKSSISTYISGEYEPKQRNIYKIAQALDVNESWLMGHDVPIERKTAIEITKEEKFLLENFQELNTLGKTKAIDYVSDLADNPKYQKETKVQEMSEPYVIEAAAAHHKTGVYDETDRRDISKMNEIARKINEQRQK